MSSIGGIGGSESSAKETNIDVSGSGQYNQKSDVAQAGSLLVGRKGTLVLPGGLSNVKLEKGSSLTIGASDEALNSLVGNLTQATSDQISAATSSTSDQLAALAKANEDQLAKFSGLLEQKTDTEAGNPKTLSWVAIAAIAGVAIIAWLLRKH